MIAPLDLADTRQAEALHRVWLAAYAQEAALLGIPEDRFPPLQKSLAELQASGWLFLGAWVGDTLAGAAALGAEADGALRLNALVVMPTFQRRGLGRQLTAAAIQQAEPGRLLRVGTGAANRPALALYASMGFTLEAQLSVGEPPVAFVRLTRLA